MTSTAPLASLDFIPVHRATSVDALVVFCTKWLLTDPVVVRFGVWRSIQPVIPIEAFATKLGDVHFYFKN